MGTRTPLKTGLRILAVCFVFGACLGVGGALAGVASIAPKPPGEDTPAGFLLPFAAFCLCVGVVVSYWVLQSSWRGWRLAAALFVATFGISIVATQVESLFFLSAKMPPGMIRALVIQGAIALALFAPLALFILGKWTDATTRAGHAKEPPPTAVAITSRIAVLVAAFVFLYMFFGYYIAWQNPALRAYYGGTDTPSFYVAVTSNLRTQPSMFLLQVARALLYIGCVYPLLRTLPIGRWQKAAATAAFLASWTTALLLPNPLMPATVARSHLWETLAFNLVFGAAMGWLLDNPTAPTSRALRT